MAISLQPDMNAEPAVERRAAPRQCTQHRVEWRSLLDAGDPPCVATVHDISADGIGLILPYWVAPGSALAVTLLDANGDAGILNLVRVKRILFQDRKHWAVGGTFVQKISEEDLKSLLEWTSLVAHQLPPQTSGSSFTDGPVLLRRQRVGVAIRHNLEPTDPEAGQTNSAGPYPTTAATPAVRERISAPTRVRIPEWRKRQILEQIRERIHSKSAADSSSHAQLQP